MPSCRRFCKPAAHAAHECMPNNTHMRICFHTLLPRRSWELDNPGLLLHEAHAAHEWPATAEEHAQGMIGAHALAGLSPVVAAEPANRPAFLATHAVGCTACCPSSHHLPPLLPLAPLPPAAELYEQFARDVAGLPVVAGRRPSTGTLPGATASFTVEAMVGAGAALQVRRSHSRSWVWGGLHLALLAPLPQSVPEATRVPQGEQFCLGLSVEGAGT